MTLSPIIERELRCGLRRGGARKLRMRYALMGAGITALCLLLMTVTNPATFGRSLHQFLFYVGLYVAVVQTPVLSAGLISRERQSQTLGLLFLAGLRPFEVFVSKVLSGALLSFTNLLALAPFMAVPFLSGGLSWQVFVATVFCLPNLLFFALAMTVLGSVLCVDEGAALIVATLLGGAIAGLAPGLYQANLLLSGSRAVSPDWLLASPGYGAYLVLRDFAGGSPFDFWMNSALTFVWSCLALSIAGAVLKRTWQDAPASFPTSDWRAGWRAWFNGTGQWRREKSRQWLDTRPFTWLAMHDRSPERLAWLLVAGIAVLWLAAWVEWPKHWLSLPNFLITAALLNGVVEGIALYAAGRRIGEDRRSGALELLLTTSLTPEEMIEDQLEALRQQFQPVFWGTLGLNLALMLGGFFLRDWQDLAAYTYGLIWLPFLFWSWRRSFRSCLIGMWASLNCGRPLYAVWRATGGYNHLSWIWILVIMGNQPSQLRNFPSGSITEFAWVGFIVLFLALAMLAPRVKANQIANRLRAEFRSIAQSPVPEPSDPRLKRWKIDERFAEEFAWKEMVLGPHWMSLIKRAARARVTWTRR